MTTLNQDAKKIMRASLDVISKCRRCTNCAELAAQLKELLEIS